MSEETVQNITTLPKQSLFTSRRFQVGVVVALAAAASAWIARDALVPAKEAVETLATPAA